MVEVGIGAAGAPERKKRGRGAAKSFPLSPFQEALVLATAIHQHGLDGQLRRISVFDRLQRSPESGSGRKLVTDSARYGLTSGGYKAEYLRLTEEGATVVNPETPPRERRRMEFELAVTRLEPFNLLYERLKGKRLPAQDVMYDELGGIPEPDRPLCVQIFMENVEYLGLLQQIAGAPRIISIEQALEEVPGGQPGQAGQKEEKREEPDKKRPRPPGEPEVHIDVNIHIDPAASPDQIDQVFASMARHLYGREP